MARWIEARDEWACSAGWNILVGIAMSGEDIPDDFFLEYLGIIENTIHAEKNRVRHAMNNAIIAIGVRNPRLEKSAIAAAKRVGRVEVDHGNHRNRQGEMREYFVERHCFPLSCRARVHAGAGTSNLIDITELTTSRPRTDDAGCEG